MFFKLIVDVTLMPHSHLPQAGTNLRGRSVTFILALLILAGFLLRVHGAMDRFEKGDSIVLALMANDIAQGVEYPLWIYGSPYAGAFESWFTAPLIWFTGPAWWVVSFDPIVISTAGILAFYLLGEAIGGSRAGLFAAALWAFAPWGASFYNISPRGCYPETVSGGAMILWYATRRWKGERVSAWVSFAIGLLVGVLIWSRLLAAPYVITLAITLLLVDRARFINAGNMAGLAGVVIGAMPFLLTWKRVMAQKAVGRMEISGLKERLTAFYNTLLAGYTSKGGVELAWTNVAGGASLIFSMGATCIFIAMAAFLLTRHSKKPQEINTIPLALFTIIFAVIYVSNTASLTSQVRYTLPLYTALLVFPALAADWLASRSKIVALAIIVLMAGSATAISAINFAVVRREEAPIRDRVRAAVTQLKNIGARSAIINDFNMMERLFYEALVRGYPLNVIANSGNLNMRWTTAVERDPDPVYLMSAARAGQFAQWLKSCCGGEHVKRDIGGFTGIHQIRVVSSPSVSIPPALWNISPKALALADRIQSTTFYSSSREKVVVTFDRPRDLTKVRLVYGNRLPSAVTMERSMDGRSWERISGPQAPSAVYPVGERVYERLPWDLHREYEEWNFSPKPTVSLRMTFDPHAGKTYDLHELFAYESSGEVYPAPSPDEIRRAAEKEGVVTLACDRRVASFFFGQRAPFQTTLMRFYESAPELTQSQWKVEPGFAALADRADADELAERLRAKQAVFSSTQMGNKTLFTFKKENGFVWWTGFTLINAQ